jgi:hypothetical protein
MPSAKLAGIRRVVAKEDGGKYLLNAIQTELLAERASVPIKRMYFSAACGEFFAYLVFSQRSRQVLARFVKSSHSAE